MEQKNTIRTREQIPVEDTWDLTPLFADDEAWEKGFSALEALSEKLAACEAHFTESGKTLLETLQLKDEAESLYERLVVYANQKLHQDMSQSVYQGLCTRMQVAGTQLAAAEAFLEPAILELSEQELAEKKEQEPGLSLYERLFQNILRRRAHTLPKEQEEILAQTMELSGAARDIFSLFNNADLDLGRIKGEDGQEMQVSNGNYVTLLQSQNREVRKAAFSSCYRAYGAFKNTLGATFLANVKQAAFYARVRKFPSALAMALDDSEIPVSVYTSLIEAVEESLASMYRYVELRKKVLDVDELHMYDVYAPMVKDLEWKVTFEEAKEMALAALAPMGEEYLSLLRQAFENRWIDIYENQNKRSGAYSWGAYGSHPYVLLNFQGTLNDVFTLVHELGHALHTYYTNETQPYAYSSYRIFVAEVASTCNESLLMQYLLKKETDPERRKYLLNYFLDQFKGTLFRQTMFAAFEKMAHETYAKEQSLTGEQLCAMYLELNKKYFGENMISDEEIAMEWARIPHFYSEFYVYQYATGFSAAIALSKKILEEGECAVAAYQEFLRGGCAKDPLSLLRIAGVDLEKPQPVRDALTLFGELVDEFAAMFA